MREVPECLNRRYRALDELISELSNARSSRGSDTECRSECSSEAGIKLMCDFWHILKEDPDCNLTQAVKQRMGLATNSSSAFGPQRVTCYMAGKGKQDEADDKRRDTRNKLKNFCCSSSTEPEPKQFCCGSKSMSPISIGSDVLPLSNILCNLKEAASFDKKCNDRITELMATQKELQDQIQHLEHREKEGIQLLKQADCMWSCMEDTYKKKVAESLERQKNLLKQLKEVETSSGKWRKNKKDLELQMNNINKCQQEITEKVNQKTNDIKCMDMEIADFKMRVENNTKDTDNAKKSLSNKKQASSIKLANIAAEVTKLRKLISDENKHKYNKEKEGSKYVKETREDLQKICRVLLQKKLQNEDLRAEKEALNEEIELLNQTCDQCKEKCKNKQQTINDEIKIIDKEIAEFKVKCIKCHQYTDTVDVRKLCTDCPRCAEERDCFYENGNCSPDQTMECVCMRVKQKFLDNVFDNMYTVLERQTKTGPGKAVADAILNCLQRSRNGKLNEETRKLLQEFILTTVKRNLNLTIVGGAVKTRCEMDPETYKQLMLCMKQVKVVKPSKEDKGTVAKKESCRRWGGSSECNCPNGPKACICTKKAPPPPKDPSPCPPTQDNEDAGEAIACPHKESTSCGPDCAMHAVPSCVGTDVATWRPDPCKEQSCSFSKSMRAAQCVLGPESLCSMPKGHVTTAPYVPDLPGLDDPIMCKCGSTSTKSCTCRDANQLKAAIIKQCDKETCAAIWEQAIGQHRYSIIENEIRTESYAQCSPVEQNKLKRIPSVQAEIFSKVLKYLDTEINNVAENCLVEFEKKSFDKRDEEIKPKISKDNFKISIDGKNDKLSNGLTEIIRTQSGSLAIELDEKVIELIEKKTAEDHNVLMSMKKTDSGHFIVDFSSKENASDGFQKISVKKSPSGNRFLEVNKSFVNKLKLNTLPDEHQVHEILNAGLSIISNASEMKKDTSNNDNTIGSCNEDATTSYIPHLRHDSKERKEHYLSELQELYEKGNKNIIINVQGRNGATKKIQAALTRTLSGNVAVDMEKISSFGDISFKTKEYPVLLTKSASGSHVLDITCKDKANALLRRTPSGGILIVAIDPFLKAMETVQKVNEQKNNNHFFRLKVKSINNRVMDPPALLKLTPSCDYLIILDKEYEKCFSQTIENYIGDESECFIEMHKTDSGYFIITLNDNDDIYNEPNALLVKSRPGHIKILAHETVFEAMTKLPRKNSAITAKAFGELLNKLRPSRELHKEKIRNTKLLDTKSNSDSQLCDKVNIKFPDYSLMTDPSAILKKTPSGQYAVALNKESKKEFVNNLKSYLSGSQGLIPIKRTKNGEITIVLQDNNEGRERNGSLRITPSGNIYVTIIKGMTQEGKHDRLSKHIIGTLKHPVNKAVATTCNARPNDSSCDTSKCVCKELKCETNRLIQNDNAEKKENVKLFQPQNCGIDWRKVKKNTSGGHKICNPYKCKEKCCAKIKKNDSSREKSPHIVIKPCPCTPVLENNPRSTEECYYIVEAVCPYHIERYQTVSNELLEISGLCTKAQEENLEEKQELPNYIEPKQQTWDSLNFLPPQLPPFLRDISYS